MGGVRRHAALVEEESRVKTECSTTDLRESGFIGEQGKSVWMVAVEMMFEHLQ